MDDNLVRTRITAIDSATHQWSVARLLTSNPVWFQRGFLSNPDNAMLEKADTLGARLVIDILSLAGVVKVDLDYYHLKVTIQPEVFDWHEDDALEAKVSDILARNFNATLLFEEDKGSQGLSLLALPAATGGSIPARELICSTDPIDELSRQGNSESDSG